MITFNTEKLRDKIQACWVGKNLGGTIGTPYEGSREINDIHGFVTKEGEVLPNDDLDLQLIWLKAVNEIGPQNVNEQTLGEYWLNYVMPNWNEYGVGKSNMREGFLPPLSGELNNARWKHSNGAWIRTEVWATLYPGQPEKAIRYAYADACVDHGFGEGTFAAIFVAAIESAAFVFNDLQVLIDIGLSKIPADCRVARSVKLARKAWQEGKSWKEAREILVEDSKDLGWFQAPANVGFVIIGLLYGEGDFKKSMIIAVNCGDDTDCTGATLGSVMGIMNGTKGLPEDWVKFMGDDIVQMCLLKGHGNYPTSNTMLTECIMDLLPITSHATGIFPFSCKGAIGFTDGEEDFGGLKPADYYGTGFVDSILSRSPYSFEQHGTFFDVVTELDRKPTLLPGESLSGKITVLYKNGCPMQRHYHLRWLLPEGYTAQCSGFVYVPFPEHDWDNTASVPFTITAGEKVEPVTRLVLEVSCPGTPSCVYVPLCVIG